MAIYREPGFTTGSQPCEKEEYPCRFKKQLRTGNVKYLNKLVSSHDRSAFLEAVKSELRPAYELEIVLPEHEQGESASVLIICRRLPVVCLSRVTRFLAAVAEVLLKPCSRIRVDTVRHSC